jgi:hypothetical protein
MEATGPDHVDVSIDGLPAVHDTVRGPGAFARLSPNLRWLVKTLPDRLWITHTLFAQNLRALPEFVSFFSTFYDVRRYSVGIYHPLPYTDASLAVDVDDWPPFFAGLARSLAELEVSRETDVILEVGPQFPGLFAQLRAKGLILSDGALSSTRHRLDNGITLRMNATRVPTGLWHSVRVTPEGYWLAAEDLVDAKRYRERAVIRLRDCHFDTRAAYESGLRHVKVPSPMPKVVVVDSSSARPTAADISRRPVTVVS